MAEYYISYGELEDFLIKTFACSNNEKFLIEHKAEILAALTGDFEEKNTTEIKNLVLYWGNQVEQPSQLLVGKKYVLMHSVLRDFLEIAITSGALEAMIVYLIGLGNIAFSLTGAFSIAYGLWKIFSSVKELDDDDFCIYMQAMTHYKEHKEFTKDELITWFPNGTHPKCNMHNSTWECNFLDCNDTCLILQDCKLNEAIKSLISKGLLDSKKTEGQVKYHFKW